MHETSIPVFLLSEAVGLDDSERDRYGRGRTFAQRSGAGGDRFACEVRGRGVRLVPRRYVSLKEVAARAGVSFQTASKVLNGGEVRVAAETAERIESAARELGYSPNTVARSLVQRTTYTIGLVAGSFADPALAELLIGAESAAREQGHAVLVSNLGGSGEGNVDVVRTLVERRVDGIVAAAPQLEEDTEVAELLRRYVPCVSLHHVPGGGVPLVGSNHRDVGRMATAHLAAAGRRHIGTVTGPYRRRVVRSRLRGYEDALRDGGLEASEDLVAESDWSPAGGAAAIRLLLEREPRLDAVFVQSDLMAVGVLAGLSAAGRTVPTEVAVVSCDDLAFAAYLNPPLTTVRLPLAETGARAVELLLRLTRGEEVDPAPVILPAELVVRASCGLGARDVQSTSTARPGAVVQ